MLKIKQSIIVEGKYDKAKLSSIVDANIIETTGFRIYKDKKNLNLIRRLAKETGIIILTDSDKAGFKIRNYICGSITDGRIINVYIPDVFGKESRKEKPSAEGKLGVEGISKEIILSAFEKAGVFSDVDANTDNRRKITKQDFMNDGLSGGQNSFSLRQKLLKIMDLPQNMSANALVATLNIITTYEEYKRIVEEIL